MDQLAGLLEQIRACTLCADALPLGPRPVVQAGRRARILIASQAPGRKVHASGIPFDDASGQRLRQWLGISRSDFYCPERVAIVPMGLCYPGRGSSGDLPPRPECAPAWREQLMQQLPHIQLTLVIGQYAHHYYYGAGQPLTRRIRDGQDGWPATVLLPHPSPRNNLWLKQNPWFESERVPLLQQRVAEVLTAAAQGQ